MSDFGLFRRNKFGTGGEIAEEYAALVRAMWSGQYKSVIPKDFKVSDIIMWLHSDLIFYMWIIKYDWPSVIYEGHKFRNALFYILLGLLLSLFIFPFNYLCWWFDFCKSHINFDLECVIFVVLRLWKYKIFGLVKETA